MSEDKILNKYIELINKGYCCACNELNCIDNFPQKKIANTISNLQQENQQLKEKVGELTQSLNEQMKLTNEENLDCSKYAIENNHLKEVIEEVKIYIEDSANQMSEDATYYLLQILDKGVKDE